MDLSVFVDHFTFGIDDEKAGKKGVLEIDVVFQGGGHDVDFISFGRHR